MISQKRIVSLFKMNDWTNHNDNTEISRLDFGRLAKDRNRKYKIQKILDATITWLELLYIDYKFPFPLE